VLCSSVLWWSLLFGLGGVFMVNDLAAKPWLMDRCTVCSNRMQFAAGVPTGWPVITIRCRLPDCLPLDVFALAVALAVAVDEREERTKCKSDEQAKSNCEQDVL
jgi:hypothetical protein